MRSSATRVISSFLNRMETTVATLSILDMNFIDAVIYWRTETLIWSLVGLEYLSAVYPQSKFTNEASDSWFCSTEDSMKWVCMVNIPALTSVSLNKVNIIHNQTISQGALQGENVKIMFPHSSHFFNKNGKYVLPW